MEEIHRYKFHSQSYLFVFVVCGINQYPRLRLQRRLTLNSTKWYNAITRQSTVVSIYITTTCLTFKPSALRTHSVFMFRMTSKINIFINNITQFVCVTVKCKKNVILSILEQAKQVKRGDRGIALLFL